MTFDMNRVVIELEYRQVVPVEHAMGTRIDCLRGRVWITERDCTQDIVLEAGQSHEISRSGAAVVQALRDALVALRAPTVPQAAAGTPQWPADDLRFAFKRFTSASWKRNAATASFASSSQVSVFM